MTKLTLALIVLLVSVRPEAVFAQSHDVRTSDRILEDYAECVVSKRTGKGSLVKKYLSVPIGSALPPNVVRQLVVADCLEGAGRMNMAPELFGRSLFSALYRRDFRKNEPSEFSPAASYDGEFDAQFIPLSANQIYLRKVGDCAAAGNLPAAHRYVVAKVWSDEEEAVLPQVISALSQCFGVGERIAFSRSMLKGILAESLYKYRQGMTQVEPASPQ